MYENEFVKKTLKRKLRTITITLKTFFIKNIIKKLMKT